MVWSWVVFTIQPVAVQNFELFGEPIVSIFSLEDNQGHVYLRDVNGELLTFQPSSGHEIVDLETGTLWNRSRGVAFYGQLQGSNLSLSKTTAEDLFPYHKTQPYRGQWLSVWQRFDANWYVTLAENGYGSVAGDDHFPPLYPLLIRILTPLTGSAFLGGLLLSHTAALLALKLLYDAFTGWGDTTVGKRAAVLYVLFPTFFFFFSAYSEPVFLVAVLLAFRAMKVRAWPWAGFWTFCAILTRLQGAALFVPMLLMMQQDPPFLRKPSHWMALSIAGSSGLFYLYLRSLQVASGAVPMVESAWHARLVPPWETYSYAVQTVLSGNFSFIDFLNWALVTIFTALLVWGWRRIPLEYSLYTAVSLLIILIRIVETQPLISMSRYVLTLFPVFYLQSLSLKNSLLRRVVIYTSLLLNLYLSGQFFIWGWVA